MAMIAQTAVADGPAVTLSVTASQMSFALGMNAAVRYRVLNTIGLIKGGTFTILIIPDMTATQPQGIGFGAGCKWRPAAGSGLGSLANGLVIPPGAAAPIGLVVSYDGANCNVTEVL